MVERGQVGDDVQHESHDREARDGRERSDVRRADAGIGTPAGTPTHAGIPAVAAWWTVPAVPV